MSPSSRFRAAGLYVRAAEIGAVASFLFVIAITGELDDALVTASAIVLVLCLLVVCAHGLRDEYTQRLWHSGLSTAFVCAVALTLGPWLFGLGLNALADLGNVTHEDFARFDLVSGRLTGASVICAFFIGFHIRRLSAL